MKMQTIGSSETSVNLYQTIWRHSPEYSNLYIHCRQNPQNSQVFYSIIRVEEEILAVQDRDGKMKPEQEDFLCSEVKTMTIHSTSETDCEPQKFPKYFRYVYTCSFPYRWRLISIFHVPMHQSHGCVSRLLRNMNSPKVEHCHGWVTITCHTVQETELRNQTRPTRRGTFWRWNDH
jgi:hypothetical protein